MNKTRKGYNTKAKIKKYYESLGYTVGDIEKTYTVYDEEKRTKRFFRRDLWGGDLVAFKDDEMIWIQCKSNKKDISSGKKELTKYNLPFFIKKIVVLLEKNKKEPFVYEV